VLISRIVDARLTGWRAKADIAASSAVLPQHQQGFHEPHAHFVWERHSGLCQSQGVAEDEVLYQARFQTPSQAAIPIMAPGSAPSAWTPSTPFS
jgi:hypothetical protein